MATAKIRWGELEDDDGGNLDFLLPPRIVSGPDENGIKKTVEYRYDDEGNKVKVTTTTRVRKLGRARLSKAAVERHSWAKFGDAASGDDASARLTIVSTEEILLEHPVAPDAAHTDTCASEIVTPTGDCQYLLPSSLLENFIASMLVSYLL